MAEFKVWIIQWEKKNGPVVVCMQMIGPISVKVTAASPC